MTTRDFIMKWGLLEPERAEMLRDLMGVLEEKYNEAYLASREHGEGNRGRGLVWEKARVGLVIHGDMHVGEMIFHERPRV